MGGFFVLFGNLPFYVFNLFYISREKNFKVTLDKKPCCRYNITNVLKHSLYNDFGAIRIAITRYAPPAGRSAANSRIDDNGETCHPNRNLRKNR